METNNLLTAQPRTFVKSQDRLLELQPHEPPLERRPSKYERLDMETQKGYPIQPIKFNNKFYIYRVR